MTRTKYTPTERDVKSFQALYNRATVLGMGALHAVPGGLDEDEARNTLAAQGGYVDYHRGRVHKVNFAKWPLNFELYDRDNGAGSGMAVLAAANITNE